MYYSEKTFIDLFAGAGCLSLGLMDSGWRGIFGVEKNEDAFETLACNLIDGSYNNVYEWPNWFPKKTCTVEKLADEYREKLLNLQGKITLVAGGPPCQGFSTAGRRKIYDARNFLFYEYMRIVEIVQPLFVLIENVSGITKRFDKNNYGNQHQSYSQQIYKSLNDSGYTVQADMLMSTDYGVPQSRRRYFVIAVKNDIDHLLKNNNPFRFLKRIQTDFLQSKELPTDKPVSVKDALSDLETVNGVQQDINSPRFLHGLYSSPTTRYQKIMRDGCNYYLPDSHRLINHTPNVIERYEDILLNCPKGVKLSVADRKRFGLKKFSTIPLHPQQPSATLTTIPNDFIHYSEPRNLTVREHARLQSIPDWFQFKGAYSTGSKRRRYECPRYTQVGNAVPPFVAEAIGMFFSHLHEQYLLHYHHKHSHIQNTST